MKINGRGRPEYSKEKWQELCEIEDIEKANALVKYMIDYCCNYHDDLAIWCYDWLASRLDAEIEEDLHTGAAIKYLVFDGVRYEVGRWNSDGWVPTCEYNNCCLK